MKENTLNKLVIGCCLLAIMSCASRKKLVTSTDNANTNALQAAKTGNDINLKLGPIREQQVNFDTFSGKAHTALNLNGDSHDVTLNIRIRKDRKIWVSITALFGIEAARALITPDSIQLLNRLQGVYISKPFSFIHTFTNAQVDFSMLQALLVGNAVPALLNDSTQYKSADSNIVLSGNLQDIIYKLVLGSDMRVTQTNLSNQGAGQSLQVSDGAFIQSGSQKLPSQIDIASVAKDKKVQVNLHYVKIDLNQPLDYPFSIPADYTQAN
jgi:hypothetical protein